MANSVQVLKGSFDIMMDKMHESCNAVVRQRESETERIIRKMVDSQADVIISKVRELLKDATYEDAMEFATGYKSDADCNMLLALVSEVFPEHGLEVMSKVRGFEIVEIGSFEELMHVLRGLGK